LAFLVFVFFFFFLSHACVYQSATPSYDSSASQRFDYRLHVYPLFSPIVLDRAATCLSDLIFEFCIDHRAGLTFLILQTTWGSRDGADDYDAERMKKRTDADRMKQPYYPQYLIK
jgi:hypothetical protein